MKLLNKLISSGLISEEQRKEVENEIKNTGKTVEEIILEKKLVAEEQLFELKAKGLGIPFKKIKAEQVSADVLEIMPEEASVNYKMAPFAKNDDSIDIGMVYPEDIAAQNALRFLANQEKFNYKVYLITSGDLREIQKQRKTISLETKKALDELNMEKGGLLETIVKKSQNGLIEEEAPIIKMVLVIIRHAIEGNASDIHLEPSRDKLTIRFRLNGILHPSLFLPLKVHPSIVARIKILSGLKIDENRLPQDGRFSTRINESDIDFRVSTFPTLYGEKVELRVLDSSKGVKPFSELGLRGRALEIIQSAIKKPYGLILFTGPTGSGKTTTQYSILKILNQDSVNIVTIEDPIEYSIPGVNQSQVRPEIGYTFASGLRQILRQDPNIIMVGEIRDEETADLVINAALTGHVVLSTLHTNSSAGVVARLMDMGVRPFLLPSTLRVVISQKLVRMLCEHCKVKVRLEGKAKEYILSKIKTLPDSVKKDMPTFNTSFVYKSKGCEKCNLTGYSGRAGIFEVLSMTDELAELIQKSPLENMIFKLAQKQGMLSMEQEGILKVLEGQTTLEEITRVVEERE